MNVKVKYKIKHNFINLCYYQDDFGLELLCYVTW